jgi:hypothetical protein
MNRVVGIETEYGCLVSGEVELREAESWPGRVRDYLFREGRAGILDLHYRDYEEPPGNGGFLLNGGRIYLDMGHIEYASPECRRLDDAVAYELAGDALLLGGLDALGVRDQVSFLKNNIDHHTGATFGCHENYLMRREVHFDHVALGTLLSFLATRQIFTGSGRVGRAQSISFEPEELPTAGRVDFQLSQRADHIVNDVYQWVQFNRAIINARDEPLADQRRYRRLHLLLGDSNMSPYATALKIGTTACVLTLLERETLPREVLLADAVAATRLISHSARVDASVEMESGDWCSALEIQRVFAATAREELGGTDPETDWVIEQWLWVLDCLVESPLALIGGVDWVTKKWLLEAFRQEHRLEWNDPWLQSLDLEYHNIDPTRGLFFAVPAGEQVAAYNEGARRAATQSVPPSDTRAFGRGKAIRSFQESRTSYIVNWDSVATDEKRFVLMPDPFSTYEEEIGRLLRKSRV